MKKKLIVMLLVVAMLPAMIFASSDILQFGLNVGYKPTLADLTSSDASTDVKDYFKMEYFTFAPELKLNLFFIDLDTTAYFNFSDTEVLIDTHVGADLYFKLFNTLKLSGGVGINMPFKYVKGDAWYINELPLTGAGFVDTLQNSNLAYRAGVGFDFGRFNMMVNYSVPTKGTFKSPDFKPEWDHGLFSLGLLIDIF